MIHWSSAPGADQPGFRSLCANTTGKIVRTQRTMLHIVCTGMIARAMSTFCPVWEHAACCSPRRARFCSLCQSVLISTAYPCKMTCRLSFPDMVVEFARGRGTTGVLHLLCLALAGMWRPRGVFRAVDACARWGDLALLDAASRTVAQHLT